MKPNMRLFILLFMICATLPCQAQWRWLYPSLRGEFRSCVMASAEHAYILTASDSVLETRDQGRTWTTMEVDGLPTFGVFFRPSLGFLVVRDRGAGSNLLLSWHILKTSDGGQSWNRLPPTFGDVVDVYFGTDSLGWLTLRTGAGLHTTDGGQTWEPNAPGTPPIIRWMDRNTWYGYRHYTTEVGRRDSVLWYSFDGGASWEARAFTAIPSINPRYTQQSGSLALTHLSADTLLAMYIAYVRDPKMQSNYTFLSIARSTDRGRAWTMVYRPVFLMPGGIVPAADDPLPRAFPYRFLTVSDSVLTVVAERSNGWLRSGDGGQQWTNIDTLFDSFTRCGIDADHAGNVIAVSASRKRVQWSIDAGVTWNRRDDMELINFGKQQPLLSTHFSGLVLGVDPYYVAISRNGNLVFTGVQALPDNSSTFRIIDTGPCHSIDDTRTVLVSTTTDTIQMYELSDDREWIPRTELFQKTTPGLSKLGTSYNLGSGHAVITADHGVIYASLDAPPGWRKVDSISVHTLYNAPYQHLKYFSREEGVCVSFGYVTYSSRTGMDSLVYYLTVRSTVDGGNLWTRIQTPFEQFIQYIPPMLPSPISIYYYLTILQRHTYLSANPDGIRRTTDWGRTWTLVYPTTESILSISAADSLHAFATTEHELLGTNDGGQTWSRITPRDATGQILSSGSFTGVFTTPSGFVLACLPDGFIGAMADSVLTGVDRPEPVLPTDPLRIYPNPGVAGGTVRIQFSQQTAGSASITLYSSLGQRLHHEILDDHHVGPRETTLATACLPPGLYFITVSTPEGVRVGKVVVGR